MAARRSGAGLLGAFVGPSGRWAAVSVIVHIGLLFWIVGSFRPPSPLAPTPDLQVWLTRSPGMTAVRPPDREQRMIQRIRSAAAPASPSAPTRSEAPPAHAAADSAGAAAATAGPGAGIAAALGALLGCQPERLKALAPDQRVACERRLIEAAKVAPRIDPLPAGKRAYYDAVRDAYQARHAPTPVAVGAPPCLTCERWSAPAGSHLPTIGCSLPLGVPRGWNPDVKWRPHTLRLGPCSIGPPQGFLTEEADIPSAADTDLTGSDRPR